MHKQKGEFEPTIAELQDPEKSRDSSSGCVDIGDKDEALRLVGLERMETFTEEQYLRVRRKLVNSTHHPHAPIHGSLSYLTGLGDTSALSGSLLFPVPVRLLHHELKYRPNWSDHLEETRTSSIMLGKFA